MKPWGGSTPDAAAIEEPAPEFPLLSGLLDRIGERLAGCGETGLLSITVLQGSAVPASSVWPSYEALVRAVSSFLREYSPRLRREDRFFETAINGNAFVLLIDAPRDRRPMQRSDLDRVRRRLAIELHRSLAKSLAGIPVGFGCHVGIAILRADATVRIERVVYRALEEAFADSLRQREREQRRSASRLRSLLASGLAHTVYQPVVDVVDCRVIGYEALTRLPAERFGTLDDLFRAAKDGEALWTLERLFRRRALEALPSLAQEQLLFLNLEPDSLHDPDLLEPPFLSELGSRGLDPRRIVLEVTEHSGVSDFPTFRRTLERVRTRGYRLALDDVGSGYSGLQAIAEIVPDCIKVDMALIRDNHLHPIKRELIATIRRFTENTGSIMIAEGVENLDELRSLVEAGVRCAQGFLFARPANPPAVPDWNALRDGQTEPE